MYCDNSNGDSNENCKKETGLDQQNKIFHVYHPFLYIFLQTALFHILLRTWTKGNDFLILF